MDGCPPVEQLERQRETPRPAIDAHLAECSSCRDRFERIRTNNALLAEMRGLGAAPEEPLPAPDGYRILERIGRGGQGVVYRAAQLSTHREVAVKVLLDDVFASDRRRRRFEREIEVVAALRHPNIVTVFDGGVTRDGRPFCAMELVDGVPLDEHRRRRVAAGAGTRELLSLFTKICRAVQHAQQRGVIHRDIKPSNVLVDVAGEPRLLDFGLAKAVHPEAPGGADISLTQEFVGTLAYAAPEQLQGDADRVDVRTDVYALGLVLHELLTGARPFETATSVADLVRAITGETPRPPSSVRGVAAGIDRDLDTIVLRALEKDPERRYPDAGALGRDVERHLAGDAIEARRDSTAYVLRRLLRRHRVAVSAAAAFLLLLIGSSIAVAIAWQRSDRMFERASRDERTARATAEFLSRILVTAHPTVRPGEEVTVRQLLDESAALVDEELGDEPAVASGLLATMARAYCGLGRHDEAERLLRRGLPLRRTAHGDDHVEVARDLRQLAEETRAQGRLDEAVATLAESRHVLERLDAGSDPSVRVETAHVLADLGACALDRGRATDARELFDRALALHRAAAGGGPGVASALEGRARCAIAEGDPAAALASFDAALDERRAPEGDRIVLANLLQERASALFRLGRLAEARSDLEESAGLLSLLFPDDHPRVVSALANVGELALKDGDRTAAIDRLDRTEARADTLAARGDAAAAGAIATIGGLALDLGETARGATLLETAAATYDAASLGASDEAVRTRALWATALFRAERWPAAEELCRRLLRDAGGPDDEITWARRLGMTLVRQGKEEPAATALERAVTAARALDPSDPVKLGEQLLMLGEIELRRGRTEAAAALLDEACTWLDGALPAEDPRRRAAHAARERAR